jgi:hypothetical protein
MPNFMRHARRAGSIAAELAVEIAPRLLIALGTALAMATLAAAEVDPAARAEGAYASRLAFAALAPLALVPNLAGSHFALAALLAGGSLWVLPAGPARGLVLVASLLLGLALAVASALGRRHPAGNPLTEVLAEGRTLLGLGLSAQALLRAGDLLAMPLTPVAAARLWGLPAIGCVIALGLCRLAPLGRSRLGLPAVSAGVGAALLLSPGWNVVLVGSLAAILAVLAFPRGGPLMRIGGGLALAGLATWLPLPTTLAVAAGLLTLAATDDEDRTTSTPWLALGLAAGVLTGGLLAWGKAWTGGLGATLPAAALVPAAWLRPPRWWLLPGLAALTLAALTISAAEAALTAPLLAAGLTAYAPRTTRHLLRPDHPLATLWQGAAGVVAIAVFGTLALGTFVLAAYPWLRERPLADTLAALRASPATLTVPELPGGTAVLDAAHPILTLRGDTASVSEVVIDSNLANASALPSGTVVANLELFRNGRVVARWPLALARDTAEWAVRRADLAPALLATAPPAWVSWVPAGGRFFAQRYRARLAVNGGEGPWELVLTRADGLPPDTSLAVFRLELRA